jgi:hypothetical protein
MNAEEKLKELSKLIDNNKTFFIANFHATKYADGYNFFNQKDDKVIFISSSFFDTKYFSQIILLKGSSVIAPRKTEPFATAYKDQFDEEITTIVSFGDTLLESLQGLETRINFILDIEKNRLFL